MEFNDKAIRILQYLDKNYYIKDKKFFTRYDDIHEWGYSILDSLPPIFGFELDICENIFKNWIYTKEFSAEELKTAWCQHKLNCTWSQEMALDLQAYVGINA